MSIWSVEIEQIEKLLESFKGNIPELEKELDQLIKSDDPNVLMLYSRRCLEVIITDLCERELKRPRKTDPLKGIIDKLNKEEKVPSHIITSIHGLNDLSTYGAHPKDFDPEQVKPALSNLAIIIKWYLKYKGIQIPGKTESEEDIVTAKQPEISAEATRKKKKKLAVFLSGLLLLIIAVVALDLLNVIDLGIKKAGISKLERSIAVLPFRNDSQDTTNAYFIDGLMEEVLNNLQRIGDLRVISRTSVEQYRNQSRPIAEIAKELGVNYIVEGSGQKFGKTFRFRVQLIRAAKEDHLWGGSYQNGIFGVENIFKMQSEIAESIASELKAIITPQENKMITRVPTSSTEAWEAYMTGRFYLNKGDDKNFILALQYFEQAKEKDPDFALAYAGIARVWNNRKQAGLTRVSEATPRIEAAIQRALELDSTLSDVHQALAGIKTWTRFDWKGGEASFRKAIEMNPNNAEAHSVYSHLLNILGRPDEAMKQIRIALELDPLNAKIKSFYGVDLLFVRKYDEAVKAFRDALDLDPVQGVAAINIYNALFLAGRVEEGLEMLKSRWKNKKEYLKAIDEGLAESGFKGAMKKLADLRAEESKITHLNQTGPAQNYAFAGEIEDAVLWIEKAYEELDPNLPYILLPIYDGLRDDPRFQEVAGKMGLPYK